MDVFINLFLLFYVHILLEKPFMNVVKKQKKKTETKQELSSKTHVAFKEVHQSICIFCSQLQQAGMNEPSVIGIIGSTQGKPSKGTHLMCKTISISFWTEHSIYFSLVPLPL